MKVNTVNWLMALGYLLVALGSAVVMGVSMWGVGVIIRPVTDWLGVQWWFWVLFVAWLPASIIYDRRKLKAAKRGEIFPPLRSGGGSGSRDQAASKQF